MRVKSSAWAGLIVASLISGTTNASDVPAPEFGPHDVTSAFFITKSENANQVHFGVHLGPQCNISGAQPVYAYWRMREGGSAPRVEGLLRREQSAYGVGSQAVTANKIRITLRAIPDRPIELHVLRDPVRGCSVTATTAIAGHATARLDKIHVQLARPFGVRYLEVVGADSTGAPARERIAR